MNSLVKPIMKAFEIIDIFAMLSMIDFQTPMPPIFSSIGLLNKYSCFLNCNERSTYDFSATFLHQVLFQTYYLRVQTQELKKKKIRYTLYDILNKYPKGMHKQIWLQIQTKERIQNYIKDILKWYLYTHFQILIKKIIICPLCKLEVFHILRKICWNICYSLVCIST